MHSPLEQQRLLAICTCGGVFRAPAAFLMQNICSYLIVCCERRERIPSRYRCSSSVLDTRRRKFWSQRNNFLKLGCCSETKTRLPFFLNEHQRNDTLIQTNRMSWTAMRFPSIECFPLNWMWRSERFLQQQQQAADGMRDGQRQRWRSFSSRAFMWTFARLHSDRLAERKTGLI